MKSIHIRDLREETLAGLKRRAARHRRSLQKEVQVLLETAAQMIPADSAVDRKLKLHIVHSGDSASTWNRDEIYDDLGR
ncbi:MAG: hypothetical protein O3C43_24805 [Verrucomicrobia bacterium]|nr:hypothetical protein [Verrucomicrobiota bacterium]MDA1069710.1 hypothetical protein [Verrucomicrobiota bacterium]